MKKILSFLATFSPAIVFAQADVPVARTIDGLLNWVIYIAGRALPLLILAALVLFLFGIVKRFFLGGKESADRAEAGKYILWGVVALFVMVSVWGLVNLLRGSFNLDNSNIPIAPAIPVQQAPYASPSTNR